MIYYRSKARVIWHWRISVFFSKQKWESSPPVGRKCSVFKSQRRNKTYPQLSPFFLNAWFLSQLEDVCQGKRKRVLLHDFWAFGTSDTKCSGFCFSAQNNLLPSKPHPTALHNNSFCAIQLAAADTQLPVCLRALGVCSWLMQHVRTVPNFKLQVWNRVRVSIPQRNCTEKLQNVIVGVLRQKRFQETSPNHHSMTLKAWEGAGSGEHHLHMAFRQGKCWLSA